MDYTAGMAGLQELSCIFNCMTGPSRCALVRGRSDGAGGASLVRFTRESLVFLLQGLAHHRLSRVMGSVPVQASNRPKSQW